MYKQPKNKKYYRHSKNYDFWLKSEGDKFTIAHRLEWDFEVNRIYQQHIVGDFNGDGHPECMRLDVDDKWYMYYPFLSRTLADNYNKITRISQDNGVYTSITYSNLTDNHIYQRAQLNRYPVLEPSFPLPVVSSVTQSNGIAPNGNILFQTGVGEYEYKASQPHAISGIDNDNRQIKSLLHKYTCTPFRKPAAIIDDHKSDSVKTYHIFYSPDNERIKSVYTCNKENITTYYLPDYEVEIANGVTTTRHYIFSPSTGHLAAVNFRQGSKSNTFYAITDHLGSVLKLVDNKVHAKYESRYSPFGVRTIVKNDVGYNFPRGYTMHEHLDQFGVINANARLYDPYLARFMSPDPYIQEPTNPQNFNRFSYCLNNPLKYSDPTGEFWWLTALNIGVNAFANGFAYKKAGQCFWQGFSRGVVSGVATANVGSAISYGGILSRGFTMAGVNVLTNGVDNLINDKRFFNNYQVAAFTGFAMGALEGAFISKEMGKNMWWGNDIAYNRGKWSIFNIDKPDYTIYFNISDVGSKSLNDCVPTTFAEIETARGGSRTYEEFRIMSDYKDGIGVEISKDKYAELLLRTFDNSEILNTNEYGRLFVPQYMETAAAKGEIFSVHFNGHADNVRALRVFNGKPILNKLIFRHSRYNMTSIGNGVAIMNIFRLR